jgi:hypothetical protein
LQNSFLALIIKPDFRRLHFIVINISLGVKILLQECVFSNLASNINLTTLLTMKKLYAAAFLFAFFSQADAQVLNQSAGWPNAAWTITGAYSTDPMAFESNPTTTANFAYDDDDAGNPHEDNIAAESPVIDLTAAFTAGEMNITVSANYGYYYLDYDVLQFEYWDAATASWVAWPGGTIPGNNTDVTDNFCEIPKTLYISNSLSIAGFSPAQLTGFKYRISYNDDIDETDWNYGFCFESPTIVSSACQAPTSLAVDNITQSGADLSWDAITGITGFEYVLNDTPDDPAGAGTATTAVTYAASGLDASGYYYFHLRTNCGSSFSVWRTIEIVTLAPVPANDACATATAIPSLPYTESIDASQATNNDGIIDVCSGMNDGVWYTFTGTGGDINVEVTDVIEWDPELGVFTGTCGTFTCVDQADAGGTGDGETLTIAATELGTTYYINIGHYSGFDDVPEGIFTVNVTEAVPATPIDNDSCATAIAITSYPYTNTQDATGATNNGGIITAGCDSDMNDGAWYTFEGTGSDVTVEVTNVEAWDPQVDVYTGTCGTFTCAGSADSGGTDAGESVTIAASVIGTTYYINVGHYDGFDDQPEGPYSITVNSVLATKSFNGASFKAYPNPVKNVWNVSYANTIDNVSVYNLLGQQVFTKAIGAKEAQIDLSSLNQGSYIVKLASNDEVQTMKIIKQ